jgi:hypothetical protein
VAAVAAGLLALIHLVVFVLPQSALTKEPYWDSQFLPHHGIGSQIAFVWDGLDGLVTGAFTSSMQATLPGSIVGSGWSWVASVAFALLLVAGIWVLATSRQGRPTLFALGSSLVLTLIASYFRHWPFGFVRTNFYLIPVLILIAGIGAHRSVRWCRALFRRPASGGSALVWPARAIAAGLLVFAVVAFVVVSLYAVGGYRQVRSATTAPAYGVKIGDVIATVRSEARPDSALVVAGVMAIAGWQYYQYEYAGKSTDTGRQIEPNHADFVVNHGSSGIFHLMERVDPGQIFVYIPLGTSGKELARDVAQVTKGRTCRQTGSDGFSGTGLLITLSCSAS